MLKNYSLCAQKIRDKLVTNPRIRNILFYNKEDALTLESPSEEQILKGKYILTRPLESLTLQSLENKQATFLSILVKNVAFSESSNAGLIQISVACSNDIWDLKEGNRLIILLEEIIKEGRYNSFGFAGKMELDDLVITYYNADITGYDISFVISDENKSNVEF